MDNYLNKPSFRDFILLVKLILLVCFFVFAIGFIIYRTGFAGICAFLLVCGIFLPLFLTKPGSYDCSCESRKRTRASNKSGFGSFFYLVRLVLLVAFFVFAIGFIIYKTGFTGLGIMLGFCALFLPLFLTKPSSSGQHSDPFLDPVYNGWLGNIFTK